jgi:hypothetical protein
MNNFDIPFKIKSPYLSLHSEILQNLMDKKLRLGLEHGNYLRKCSLGGQWEAALSDQYRFSLSLSLKDYLCTLPQEYPAGERVDIIQLSHEHKDVRMFVGKNGNKASLHFDWNPGSITLINLLGRKRIYLKSPSTSSDIGDFANLAKDRIENPIVFELEQNEALYIPTFWWHGVDYLSECVSLSIRRIDKDLSRVTNRLYPSWKFIQIWSNRDLRENLLKKILMIRTDFDQIERVYETFSKSFETSSEYKGFSVAYLKNIKPDKLKDFV